MISAYVISMTVMVLVCGTLATTGTPNHDLPECQQLESLASHINGSRQQVPIIRECLQNAHCTGINCHAKFRYISETVVPKEWLQPFCYAFELMSCTAPLQVLFRLIDQNVHSTNYTYYFTKSDIRPVDKFKAKIHNVLDVQLYLNVTFVHDPHQRVVTFGVNAAVKVDSDAFGHYQQFPEWGKVELVPVTRFTVAECTPKTNFTISWNPCDFVPNIPHIHPTYPPPHIVGNCSLTDLYACGDHQMCIPNPAVKSPSSGLCTCSYDATYDEDSKTCKLNKPSGNPHDFITSTTVVPKTVQNQPAGGHSNVSLYIGISVGIIIVVVMGGVGFFFYRKHKARYGSHTRVLMVDDGLDTALMSDEDDMPISL